MIGRESTYSNTPVVRLPAVQLTLRNQIDFIEHEVNAEIDKRFQLATELFAHERVTTAAAPQSAGAYGL